MKKLSRSCRSRLILVAIACLSAGLMAGCHHGPVQADKDAAEKLMEQGYSPSPVVTEVLQSAPGVLTIKGRALPDGRVRFILGPQRAIGVTADSKGHFSADLPASPNGNIFDLLMEDRGRLIHAEGRLFVPPGLPAKAVIMRPGAPSLPVVAPGRGLAIIDYDSAGVLAVVGQMTPKIAINLVVDDQEVAPVTSDAKGMFTATTRIPPPEDAAATVTISAQGGSASWQRDVVVTRPNADGEDRITLVPEGWRVDWKVPGGGMQTTLVF